MTRDTPPQSRPLSTTGVGGDAQIPPEAQQFQFTYRGWLTESAEPVTVTVRGLTVTEDSEVHLIYEIPEGVDLDGRPDEAVGEQLKAIFGGYCGIPDWGGDDAWTPARLRARCITPDGTPVLEWRFFPEWARRYVTGEWDDHDLVTAIWGSQDVL